MGKNKSKKKERTEFQNFTSTMAKLDYQMKQEEIERKKAKQSNDKKKTKNENKEGVSV